MGVEDVVLLLPVVILNMEVFDSVTRESLIFITLNVASDECRVVEVKEYIKELGCL